MLYCVSNAACPIEYISCGNLVSENGFLHDRRTLDSWVFIVVQKGTLHIAQNEQKFDITENETLLLFPHQTHYGYKKSEGYLSYYWVHFYIKDPDYAIYSRNTLLRQNNFLYDMFPPPRKSAIFLRIFYSSGMQSSFSRKAYHFTLQSIA